MMLSQAQAFDLVAENERRAHGPLSTTVSACLVLGVCLRDELGQSYVTLTVVADVSSQSKSVRLARKDAVGIHTTDVDLHRCIVLGSKDAVRPRATRCDRPKTVNSRYLAALYPSSRQTTHHLRGM